METSSGGAGELIAGHEVLYGPRKTRGIAKHIYGALRRHRTYKMEFPCRRKGGKNIVCLVSVARIGDSLQDRKIIATYEDITEQKRVEQALEESERTLRALLRTYRNPDTTG